MRIITILAISFVFSGHALSQENDYEKYNDCDIKIEHSDLKKNECNVALPPLNAGDCLITATVCINPGLIAPGLLMHSGRKTKLVDKDDNTVIIQGETLSFTVMILARDKKTLDSKLKTIQIQARSNNGWKNIRSLTQDEYENPSNIRTYTLSDCGKGMREFKRDFEAIDKVAAIEADIKAPGMGTGGMPGNTLLPGMSGDNERFFNDWRQRTWEKSVASAGELRGNGSCPNKILPYYWTTIAFKYTPGLHETQIRLKLNPGKLGAVTMSQPFKVYSAAATNLKIENNDGNREFTFDIYAAGETNITSAGVIYDKDTLSSVEHRTPVTLGPALIEIINGHAVKRIIAKGKFPFTKTYWDDVSNTDIASQTISQPNDISPIGILGGGTVAYRLIVSSNADAFNSKPASFTMPRPFTIALLGDSFASGQGSPFLEVVNGSVFPWQHDGMDGTDCHRSRYSGQYRAVQQLIKNSNKSIDFIFVACEGATTQDIYLQNQRTAHNPDGSTTGELKQNIQIDLVKDWMNMNNYPHLNIALFGVGGNNVGFATAIQLALLGNLEHLGADAWLYGIDDKTKRLVEEGFTRLQGMDTGSYSKLDRALRSQLNPANIVIFNYPDLSHGPDNQLCNTDCNIALQCRPQDPHTISRDEMEYGDYILTKLNSTIQTTSLRLHWKYVDIFANTKGHGLCNCFEPYIQTWSNATCASLNLSAACSLGKGAMVLGASCSFHPNPIGYEHYIVPIRTQLETLLNN